MSTPVRQPLIPEQRHQEILRLLRREGVLSIRHLTDAMNVSHMTVRRDIAALEESGQVLSVQGGVRLADWSGQEPPRERESRAQLELPRKQAIASLAATFVEDDMVVFLDAGTTCQSVVPYLADRRDLTVVTNDFYVVTSLFAYPNVETIHTGGVVDASSGSSSGRLAAETVRDINLDLCFMSTGTWNMSRGVTTPSMDKVELKLAAMEAASNCYLLADSTKFGTFAKFRVTPLDKLDAVVTDNELPEEMQENIRELGVEVHIAQAG
ncbi:DeoR/GlpR family DNA-binding transcription regulator [Arthrobacter sp. M4]|uniref:DeoR/GlpR family DNA-binding transcription regulator n=1 Tax=Arthrobacter sp. M4 TaxID=218160 RepID=UPI001CDD81C4|nr:DeoR/GlpR family DNA-binding transcription regulator [Arthrobacter sp. M4]MCA4133033.1 DeoR/GlpR family DNA-binding transcription regulator [Arthrobacter sp. M4]